MTTDPGFTLFLCGDVMTGRGIDQILPHPAPPGIYEGYLRSARDYVRLAERASGPIPAPVAPDHVWGEALDELARAAPLARIVNLETAITLSEDFEPKGINYRMSPDNIACLSAAGIDCCVLANNHVLDWGRRGLADTLDSLDAAGIGHAGAGRDAASAATPWVRPLPAGGRLLVFGAGHGSSGIPGHWAAGPARPGVALLPDLSNASAERLAERVLAERRPGDVVVVSVHWGGNWGYEVPAEQRRFAHLLIDSGAADIVHGHSSHHAKALEMRDGRPVFYGCGDFITDYEGIEGHESFRSDLSVMYLVTFRGTPPIPHRVRMVPFRMQRFRLNRACAADTAWLADRLNAECRRFGATLRRDAAGGLVVDGAG
ncbi:CapA family protein [Polymorphum gilvum]|uniref:Putative Metallo-dependent phosphatase putative capsule biosynthesis protein n=1 Tax=Polymorphum gilvum (strain LMG 25793 / CGMCC 1.9160 / SL003B-26A1) TaxID=991905 RepID=F2IYS2_POLGS|nr:CapA family protein [Polymorphum gilvum]ADZ69519.1 Putative Metallo-dependent phosphatase; putative capsule biosynthesis protein [Polymorphum gilvum SL003B-26A1]